MVKKLPEKLPKSSKKRLSSDLKIVLALLKRQPQPIDELCRNARIDKSTFYSDRPILLDKKVIKQVRGGWALWNYEDMGDRVRKALEQFKEECYTHVSLIDLANKVGERPKNIEKYAYNLAPKCGLLIAEKSLKGKVAIF